jgi:hypothetical protein
MEPATWKKELDATKMTWKYRVMHVKSRTPPLDAERLRDQKKPLVRLIVQTRTFRFGRLHV